MKKLLIVGAGGFGREVLQWAKAMNIQSEIWGPINFLDDNLQALDQYHLPNRIEGTISEYTPQPGEYFVCAISDPLRKLDVCRLLSDKGAKFANIIHPTAVIADDCSLGEGVIICPHAALSTNVKIGDHVAINTNTCVGHDSIVGNGCSINGLCTIMGNVILEEGVFTGCGAHLLPKVRVGRKAKIGAGSIVIRNVKPCTSVFGNPAVQIY